MPNFLSGSVVIAFIIGIIKAFIISYKNSQFCKAVKSISNIWKYSSTYAVISHYVNKSPYFLNSLTYRLIRALVRAVDKLMGTLNRLFSSPVLSSGICYEIGEVQNLDSKTKINMLGLGILSLCIGFLTGKIALGETSTQMIVSVWIVFFMGVCLLVVSRCHEIIKSSLIFRFFNWLVKM